MASISDVARAFVEGRTAKCHNAVTDGATYWLHGHPIATKGDGVVKFDFCGWRTNTTVNHMSEIIGAGKLGGFVSRAKKGGSPDQFEKPAAWAKPAPASASGHQPPRTRYHRIDGWRGYEVPAFAVAGSSDTGMYSDSPCPSDKVAAEVERLRDALGNEGIRSKLAGGTSSNVFCGKVWIVVGVKDFERAAQFALDWLEEHKRDTRYLHDADQEQLGYKVKREEVAQ